MSRFHPAACLLIATTIAAGCGGGTDAQTDVVSCGTGWQERYPGIPLNGKCHRVCQVLTVSAAQSCKQDVILNGQPTQFECAERSVDGVVVDDGGELFCCTPTTQDNGDVEIRARACL